MKSALALAAALALCGSAFAGTTAHGLMNEARQDAHQIGSSFRHDMHRIARGDTFRQEQAADQHRTHSSTTAMGAGPSHSSAASSRQARMEAAYADWQRSHRR